MWYSFFSVREGVTSHPVTPCVQSCSQVLIVQVQVKSSPVKSKSKSKSKSSCFKSKSKSSSLESKSKSRESVFYSQHSIRQNGHSSILLKAKSFESYSVTYYTLTKLDLTATCHSFERDGASLWVRHGWTRVQRQHLLLEQITQSSQADTVYWGHFRVFSKIRDSLHWPAADYTSSGTLSSSVLLLMSVLSVECRQRCRSRQE